MRDGQKPQLITIFGRAENKCSDPDGISYADARYHPSKTPLLIGATCIVQDFAVPDPLQE